MHGFSLRKEVLKYFLHVINQGENTCSNSSIFTFLTTDYGVPQGSIFDTCLFQFMRCKYYVGFRLYRLYLMV